MFRWTLVLLLVFPAFATAQMVRGTVSDATSGLPIKAVSLSLYTMEGRRLVAGVSNDDGRFEIVLPKGKTVYLQAERIGYGTVKSEAITASTSELLQLNVRMSEVAIPVQGIEVASRKSVEPRLEPFLDRASLYKRAGIGRIWTRADLEKHPVALISQFVTRIPQRRDDAISRANKVCEGTTLYVDDIPVGDEDSYTFEDLDMLVAPDEIEGIEMYRDTDVPGDLRSRMFRLNAKPLPGELVPPAGAPQYFCMMVMIWRKPYSELYARRPGPPVTKWKLVTAWLGVAGLFLIEQAIW